MKKYLIVILLLYVWATFSYGAGPPVQPVINLKGCWQSEFVMTQTGGSSQNKENINDLPFYARPGSKRVGYQYLWIENQSGMKVTGTIVNRSGSDWFRYPFEGYINGNLIAYYSYVPQDNAISGLEEQRTFNGLINQAGEIWGSGITARNLNPDAVPNWGTDPAHYGWRWSVIPLTMKFVKTSDTTCANPPSPASELSDWGKCLPANNLCAGIPAGYVAPCQAGSPCPWCPPNTCP